MAAERPFGPLLERRTGATETATKTEAEVEADCKICGAPAQAGTAPASYSHRHAAVGMRVERSQSDAT
jgi:hypothetical protein